MFAGLGLEEFRPIDIWIQGNFRSTGYGFTFRRDEAGRPLFRSPFAPLVAGQAALSGLSPGDAGYPIGPDGYIAMDHPLGTNVMWGIGRQAVLVQVGPAFQALATGALVAQGMGAEDAQATAAQLTEALPGVVPEQLPGLQNVMGRLNIESEPLGEEPDPDRQSFFFVLLRRGGRRHPHHGLRRAAHPLGRHPDHRAGLQRIENFVGAISVETPNVFLDPQSLGAALAVLDAAQVPGVVQGNNNGTPVDELAGILTSGAAAIPYGTVSPEQASDPYAMIMSYRNFEDVTIHGLDLSLAWYPADRWRLTGNYSFVDNNFFENLKYLHSEGGADVALNAPRHKAKLGANYDFGRWELSAGGRARYTGAFPMSSGVFVGEVDSYTVLDLNLAYRLPLEQDLVLRVEVSNLLGGTYQAFVGAPAVGRLVFAQLGCRF